MLAIIAGYFSTLALLAGWFTMFAMREKWLDMLFKLVGWLAKPSGKLCCLIICAGCLLGNHA
jgi:hypothetical protein